MHSITRHAAACAALAVLLCAVSAGAPVRAQAGVAAAAPLVVGTTNAPPFAFKDEKGEWTGISITLLQGLSKEIDRDYRLEERPFRDLLDGVADGSLDVAIAAISITEERERRFDFTHPFYTTGLGIAVAPRGEGGWLAVARGFLSLEFLRVVSVLALVLLGAGALVWLFERRRNAQQFGGGVVRGLGDGFWWSAVTMTTVGYGDKAPITFGGRVVGLVWMFVSIVIISSFTAAITSSLTLSRLEGPVQSVRDLPKVRVGAPARSTGAAYLEGEGIRHRTFDSTRAGLEAIANGELDAFINDAPILRYLANGPFAGRVQVLSEVFDRQDYGIALPPGSPLREALNRAILQEIRSEKWQRLLRRYLGD